MSETAQGPGVRGVEPVDIRRLTAPPDPARSAALVRLDAELQRELGAAYSHEPWEAAHFARDLAGKWALSHVASTSVDCLAGFWIASRRGDDAHTHRVAVARETRRLGVGGALFRAVAAAARASGATRMTLTVSAANAGALAFYARAGFAALRGSELERFLAETGRPGAADGDAIEETHPGARYRYVALARRLEDPCA